MTYFFVNLKDVFTKHQTMTIKTSPSVLLLLACCMLAACNTSIERQLDRAELLLDNHPDSALSILSQIRKKDLVGKRTLAHYALLKSAALDKNYIDTDNDSLIHFALDYYQRNGSSYDRMRALYYSGIVKKNAKDYAAAVVYFDKAEQEAQAINNRRYQGLALRNMGTAYNNTGNFVEAKKHIKNAIDVFEKNNDTIYADYAKYALAINYINEKQMDSSGAILNNLRYNKRIPSLKYSASIYYANTLVSRGDSLDEAIKIYRRIPRKYFSLSHYGYYANAFAKLSQLDSARKWMDEGYKHAKTRADSAKLHSFVYNIDLLEGHPIVALNKISEAMAVQDSSTRQVLLQSLSIAQKNYYQHEASIQEDRAQKNKVLLALGSIIFLLVLLCALLLLTKRHKEQESLLKEQMAQLALLYTNSQKDKGAIVGNLFLERIARLGGLSGEYFFCNDTSEESMTLLSINNAVKEVRQNPSLFSDLENDLNEHCHGVMEKLTAQVPSIKGTNKKIISLFFAGIPDKVIQLIMNRVSVGSLKTLRSRFRTIIKEAEAPDEALFLEMLTVEKQPGKKPKQ